MASRYIANTPDEQKRMLGVIGAGSLEELLVKIPPKARLARPLGLTAALAETDLIRHMAALAARNAHAESHVSFLGAGSSGKSVRTRSSNRSGRRRRRRSGTPRATCSEAWTASPR